MGNRSMGTLKRENAAGPTLPAPLFERAREAATSAVKSQDHHSETVLNDSETFSIRSKNKGVEINLYKDGSNLKGVILGPDLSARDALNGSYHGPQAFFSVEASGKIAFGDMYNLSSADMGKFSGVMQDMQKHLDPKIHLAPISLPAGPKPSSVWSHPKM